MTALVRQSLDRRTESHLSGHTGSTYGGEVAVVAIDALYRCPPLRPNPPQDHVLRVVLFQLIYLDRSALFPNESTSCSPLDTSPLTLNPPTAVLSLSHCRGGSCYVLRIYEVLRIISFVQMRLPNARGVSIAGVFALVGTSGRPSSV